MTDRQAPQLGPWARLGTGSGVLRIAESLLGSLLTAGSVAWAFDLYNALGLNLYDAQFFGGMLAVALSLGFIRLPAQRGSARSRVPWYDWIAALVAFACAGYIVWEYQRLVDLVLMRPTDAVIVGSVMIILSLEALRRATGTALVVICVVFIAYTLLGDALPGRLGAQPSDWAKLSAYLALDVNGILGRPLAVATTIVVSFLLFGQLLNRTGGSSFFTDIAMITMGGFRGGPAKVAVVASALFGAVSGSAVANVVATGVVTIPLIKRSGYVAHRAAAIEAVSSTGGQLMPPVMGASAFLMAEFLSMPYSEVVLAALVPGVLYYLALFLQADLEAARLKASGVDSTALPGFVSVLKGAYFALPFAALLIALFNFNQSPAVSAGLASAILVVCAVALGYQGKRPRLRDLLGAIPGAGVAALEIILVCIGAGMVIGVLAISGLGFNMTFMLVQIGEGNLLGLILLAAGVCIVLGMGLPTVGVYVLLAALIAPALVKVGVEPIAAHLYVMYFGMMSMITPPVAIAAFAAAGLAGADPMRTGWSAMQFGWLAYLIPILFVLSPTLVMIGEPLHIALAILTAVLGIWLVSVAIAGFAAREVSRSWRAVCAVTGLCALVPAGAFDGAIYSDVLGVLLGGAALVKLYGFARRTRTTSNGCRTRPPGRQKPG